MRLGDSFNQNSQANLSRPSGDFALDVARGLVEGHYPVNKFGRAPDGVQTTATDIWARANATPTQQIWLAPTAARIHTIASSSASDTTGGVGVNAVKIWFLPSWNERERSVTVTGNLNGGIAMTEAAVTINRMKVVTQATTTAATLNVGTITATAAVNATVTAAILPNKGQTQLAIFSVPSTQKLYVTRVYSNILGGANIDVDFSIVVNNNPTVNTTNFLTTHTFGNQGTGTSARDFNFTPPQEHAGPCIIKMQAISNQADQDVSAGFDGILIDN
jgi:hypothetical protein